MRTTMVLLAGALLASMAERAAVADESTSAFVQEYGLEVSLGVGVMGFTSADMRAASPDAGTWDLRVSFGTHKPVGFEAAYLGAGQSFRGLGMAPTDNATLLSSSMEANLRVNFFEGEIEPFLFAGMAWKRYDLTNTDAMTPGIDGSDNVLELPFGAGFALHNGPLVFDARWSYRMAGGAELVPTSDGHAAMHAWTATMRIGYQLR